MLVIAISVRHEKQRQSWNCCPISVSCDSFKGMWAHQQSSGLQEKISLHLAQYFSIEALIWVQPEPMPGVLSISPNV